MSEKPPWTGFERASLDDEDLLRFLTYARINWVHIDQHGAELLRSTSTIVRAIGMIIKNWKALVAIAVAIFVVGAYSETGELPKWTK